MSTGWVFPACMPSLIISCMSPKNIASVFFSTITSVRISFTVHITSCKDQKWKFVSCESDTVYEIPFKCGFCYTGHSKCCINDRSHEYALKVKNEDCVSEVAEHVQDCNNYEPMWNQTTVLVREVDLNRRLFQETLHICQHGNCVSRTSLTLAPTLKRLLGLPSSLT